MPQTNARYQEYREKMRFLADIRNASALLQWDQETYLPPKGAQFRGQQISTLSELSHRLFSEEALGDLLNELINDSTLSEEEKRNVQRTKEDYDKNKKYSSSFVRAMSEQVNQTFHAWIEARSKNSFTVYEKPLAALIKLKKEEAEILGYHAHPYDALLNEFEKGATVKQLDASFGSLLPQLKELLDRIAAKPQVDDRFLKQHYPAAAQWDWGMELIRGLGFDFEAGRQDRSEHPFSVSFSSKDVRITTRIDENDFGNMTWSCIHEAGHGMYEQGLEEEAYGLPMGEACSYSIHESQSRLWENNVGRGLPFWKFYFPRLQERFPEQLKGVDAESFFRGINRVEPSLIRTEADEITYHFHVFIRYELEKQLITGAISAGDIPSFWNEQYKKWLGVDVPDDKRGCLQDVHWSHGSFGYFPTYSLGSFYAAQLFAKADEVTGGLEKSLEAGNTAPLLQWLRKAIHQRGRFHTSEELCLEATGEGLDVGHFMSYLLDKYASIYTL